MKKVMTSIFGLMVFSIVLFSCKPSVEPHEHTFSDKWTSNETEHWHAATCEHTNENSEKAKHAWDTGIVTKNADCTTAGEKVYKCTVCNVEKKEEIPALGHKEDSKTILIIPTCGVKGRTIYTCSVCGNERLVTRDPLGWCETALDAETYNKATNSSKYIYFGVFPRTVKSSSVTVDETETKKMGNSTFYKGSDDEWYVKIYASPYCMSYLNYSDGTTIINEYAYFKVEPIKWKVLTTDYNGTKKAMLLAEEVLTANVPYYTYGSSSSTRTVENDICIYPNNYKYSQIRAYLNGLAYYNDYYSNKKEEITQYANNGFLQNAFTSNAQTLIAETTVVNNGASTSDFSGELSKADGTKIKSGSVEDGDAVYYPDYTCADTIDKIFLLSEQEVTNPEYGFSKYDSYGIGNTRIRVTTDYARANNVYQEFTSGYGGCWFLRSPYSDKPENIMEVGNKGSVYNNNANEQVIGIVPALTISLE